MNVTRDSAAIGTLYCILSAAAYTAYNVCLRHVSGQSDPAWVNCVQASVSAFAFGACLLWQTILGKSAMPPRKEFWALILLGLVTQLGGVLFVWGMSVVGVAVATTLQTGGMLAISAVLGLWVLGERVSTLQIVAIVLITISAVLLAAGAQSASPESVETASSVKTLLGVVAGVLSGLAFAALTVGIRKTVTGSTSPQVVVFLINLMGVVFLGPWSVYSSGLDAIIATPPRDLAVMLAAGVFNLIAFLLVTKSLQMISVVRFNVLNNGLSAALTAAVGLLLLSEPSNATLLLGILLSVAGIVAISLAAPPADAAGEQLESV